MFDYGNVRLFFIKIFFGMIFIIIALGIFFSLISHNIEDPGYGVSTNINHVQNLMGIYGAYASRFFYIFFGITSYLFSLFILINGIRLLLGIPSYNFFIKLFFFIIGISFLNLSISLLNVNLGIFSIILKNLFYSFLGFTIVSDFILWMYFLLGFTLSITLIYFSTGLKFQYLSKKVLSILRFFKHLKKILIFLKFFKIILPKKKSIILSSIKNKKRSEPTISRNIFHKDRNLNNQLNTNQSSVLKTTKYTLPNKNILKKTNQYNLSSKENKKYNLEFSKKLENILREYGVEGKVINFESGPVVTLYEFIPAAGIKTSKIIGLSEDITRAMSSLSTRISTQPGKNTIGIEIPNNKRDGVYLGDLFDDDQFSLDTNKLILALGTDIAGQKIFTDLKKMPHLLIAGTTGSGKSVGINGMILSLLFRFTPSECKLILIDPKMLEFSIYEDIPHLLTPVVTDPKKAVFALKWVVREMENRYKLMSSLNVKNIDTHNTKILKALSDGRKLFREVQTGIDKETRKPIIERREIPLEKMPLIVVVIDEMADLMMVAGKEVESLVQRLAQMARASGIHLITATQRPSVDVITGTIKANFPSRISYRVASRFDSRTILNEIGAEQLLGSGDMLFLENGANLKRLHGGFISEKEIEDIVKHIKSQESFKTQDDITLEEAEVKNSMDFGFGKNEVDELYEKALQIVIEQQKVSTSFIQRYLQIGYNRAARIVEKMEEEGIISEPSNAGKRMVLKKN